MKLSLCFLLLSLSLLSLSSADVAPTISLESIREAVHNEREKEREKVREGEKREGGFLVWSGVTWCHANTHCDQSVVYSGEYIDYNVTVSFSAGSFGRVTSVLIFTPDTHSRLLYGSVTTTSDNAVIFSGNSYNDVDVIVNFGTASDVTESASVFFRVQIVNTVDGFLLLNEEKAAMVFQVPGASSSFVSYLPDVAPPILFTGAFSGAVSVGVSLMVCVVAVCAHMLAFSL